MVYRFTGLVIFDLVRTVFGGTGFGILSGIFCSLCYDLPTVTFMTAGSLRAVPSSLPWERLAMGATRWQAIWRVTRRLLSFRYTAVVFGVALSVKSPLRFPDELSITQRLFQLHWHRRLSVLTMGCSAFAELLICSFGVLAFSITLDELGLQRVWLKVITKKKGRKTMHAKLDKLWQLSSIPSWES